jgi:hypothetical protein
MKSRYLDTLPPNDDERLEACCRVMLLEDQIVNAIDKECATDRAMLRAMVILAYLHLDRVISEAVGPTFGFASTERDRNLFERCVAEAPNENAFRRARSFIRSVDSATFGYGFPRVDEMAAAICDAGHYVLRGRV